MLLLYSQFTNREIKSQGGSGARASSPGVWFSPSKWCHLGMESERGSGKADAFTTLPSSEQGHLDHTEVRKIRPYQDVGEATKGSRHRRIQAIGNDVSQASRGGPPQE